jgi:hypothetical protein
MSDAMTATSPQVQDRFANAPVLPFERSSQWFARGRSIARQSPFVLLLAAMLTLLARWQLDLFGTGNLIVLSYLTDAIVFTWVFLGMAARATDPAASAWRGGHIALKGRRWAVAVCSLWGLPAALVSHVMFMFAPELIKALVLAVGSNLAGLVVLLVVVMAAAYATFLLSMLPVLAAIQAGRDVHASFKVAGLWALRALRAGRRPLAAVFVTFISGCVLAAAGLTYLYGHMPVAWLQQNPGLDALLSYWYPWPGLFVALYAFLAMLHPMASDMLSAADVDLSDEILSDAHKAEFGQRHVGWLLRRAGFALRSLAAMSILLGLIYGAVLGSEDASAWFVIALLLYGVGKVLTRWGNRRRDVAIAAAQPTPAASTNVVPAWVGFADKLLALGQWGGLIYGLSVVVLVRFFYFIFTGSGNNADPGDFSLQPFGIALACFLARRWWLMRYREG